MKILIIKLAALGDVLRTTSFLRPLIKKYPAEIDWLTSKNAAPLLENNPYIKRVFVMSNEKDEQDILKEEYEMIISLEEEEAPAHIANRVKHKRLTGVCYEKGKLSYTPETSYWFDMSLISRFGKEKADELKKRNKQSYQDIWMEILGLEKKDYEPVLVLTEKEKEFGKQFAIKNNLRHQLVIGFNTGAGRRWPMKSLSEEKTAWLIDKVQEELKAKALIFGGKDEKERNQRIAQLCKRRPIDTGTNSLREFAALLNLCDLIVVSDTLALHIATALGKKTVAFFGPTSAAEIELYGKGSKIVPDSECYCCYRKDYVEGGCIETLRKDKILTTIKNNL